MLSKLLKSFTVVLCLSLLLTSSLLAKDLVLEEDFVSLEKRYIPALFFTGGMAMPFAGPAMSDYQAEWQNFSEKYYFYRADAVNWQDYFDQIDWAIASAAELVAAAKQSSDPTLLLLARDELNKVRLVMSVMRPKNGFPKFITDKFTEFHGPMEAIVKAVKGKTEADLTPALLDMLQAASPEVEKSWSEVEKCPVDPELWGLNSIQMQAYYSHIAAERVALDNFSAALASGNAGFILQTGVAIKPHFVEAKKTFGDFARYLAQ